MLKMVSFSLAILGTIAFMVISTILVFGSVFPTNKRSPTSTDDCFIDILESKIRYRITGDKGPAIILLHSFGGTLDMWKSLAEYMDCGRIISLDLIGFGWSDHPHIFYDLETHRRFLLAFMDALKVKRAILVGSSMGASIAVWTAARSSHRVVAIVLFAPSGYPSSMRHIWPMTWFYRPGPLNNVAHMIVQTRLFEGLFPNSLACQALGVTSSYNSSFAKALTQISHPTLLIWSSGDRRVPFLYSKVYCKAIPHAKLITIPSEVGHNAIALNTQQTALRICEFLSSLN